MKPILSGAILVLLTVTIGPVAAQPASTDLVSAQLAEEMKGIRQALDRLVAFRESTDYYQRVELVMKRIELSERRLMPLEAKLVTVEAAIEKDEGNLQALARMKEQQETFLKEQISEGVDKPRSETRIMLKDIERSVEGFEEKKKDRLLRKQEIENDLAMGRKDTEILDELLMEMLEEIEED